MICHTKYRRYILVAYGPERIAHEVNRKV